jgi:hypothetical protein
MKVENKFIQSLSPETAHKWAVTLFCDSLETIESRAIAIVRYLAHKLESPHAWMISDIDATGELGDRLTQQGNNLGNLQLTVSELLALLREDGQVIELEATLVASQQELFKILIRDGCSIDVLGTGDLLPKTVLGDYEMCDRSLFLW